MICSYVLLVVTDSTALTDPMGLADTSSAMSVSLSAMTLRFLLWDDVPLSKRLPELCDGLSGLGQFKTLKTKRSTLGDVGDIDDGLVGDVVDVDNVDVGDVGDLDRLGLYNWIRNEKRGCVGLHLFRVVRQIDDEVDIDVLLFLFLLWQRTTKLFKEETLKNGGCHLSV
jgi:hypothetical protein